MWLLHFTIFAQQSPGVVCDLPISSSLNLRSNMTTCITFPNSYNQAPVITLNVNIHFVPTGFPTQAEGIIAAKKLLEVANEMWSNLQPYEFPAPNGSPVAHVRNAKLQYKLYSEPSNTADVNGGIWFYQNGQSYSPKYGNKVIDIVILNDNTPTSPACSWGGFVYSLGPQNDNNIFIYDFYCHYFFGLLDDKRILNHELGHRLGLNHSYYCNNECKDIDLNVNTECNPRCPQVTTCGPNPGPGNGGSIDCNGTILGACNTGGTSNNLMGQGNRSYAITPCQWETMFNGILNFNPQYALLCYTASVFTLPQSPLNDYRASQSITSTSVLQGDRQVDYWSPTITLNPGFEVRQGTAFVAAPSTFPCCPGAGNGGGNAISDNDSNTPTNKITDVLLVTPNPFNESVNIDYEVNQDFENVNMSLVDINGRILKNIQTESKNKGRYQVQVKTNDLPNGVYFIRYKSQYKIAIQKVIKSASN